MAVTINDCEIAFGEIDSDPPRSPFSELPVPKDRGDTRWQRGLGGSGLLEREAQPCGEAIDDLLRRRDDPRVGAVVEPRVEVAVAVHDGHGADRQAFPPGFGKSRLPLSSTVLCVGAATCEVWLR